MSEASLQQVVGTVARDQLEITAALTDSFDASLREALLERSEEDARWWAMVAGPWFELFRSSNAHGADFRVVTVRRGGVLVALGFVWIVRSFDAAASVGGPIYALTRALRRLHPNLLKHAMAFMMPPVIDGAAMWIAHGLGDGERRQVWEAAQSVLKQVECDALCVFDRIGDDALERSMTSNSVVVIPHERCSARDLPADNQTVEDGRPSLSRSQHRRLVCARNSVLAGPSGPELGGRVFNLRRPRLAIVA